MDAPFKTTFVPKTFSYEKFENRVKLGEGGYGSVFKASYPCYAEVALKQLKTTEEQRKELRNLVKYNYHTNVIKFYGEAQNLEGEYVGIVLEYMDGGSLDNVIHGDKSYSKAYAYKWIVQASNGLSYLHDEKVVHRDVKPANMLLSSDRKTLKICDFGLTQQQSRMKNTWAGTPRYMAPEILTQSRKQSYPVDVYALALCIWELLMMKTAYEGIQVNYDMICKDHFRPEITFKEKELVDFIKRMWHTDPDMRPPMTEVSVFANEMEEKHTKTKTYVQKPDRRQKDSGLEGRMNRMSVDDSTTSSSNSSASGSGRSTRNTSKSSIDLWMTSSGEVKSTLKQMKLNNALETLSLEIEAVSLEMSKISRKQKVEAVDKSVKEVKSRLQVILDLIRTTLNKYPGLRILVDFQEETEKLGSFVDDQASERKSTILSRSK